MERLDDALTLCVDNFENCPVYQELLLSNGPVRRKSPERLHAAG